ncbi:MAG TPA: hypothetical protein VNO79_11480 [Actinomycetota bacterium]|nr:hypothetical protein [Actinomycetota bacterium]
MPEDRAARTPPRCASHPRIPAAAVCDACGRPLCLGCAIPVRGRVLGPCCLETALGPVPDGGHAVRPAPDAIPAGLVGASLALATLATALPWTRFGVGSGAFGAWSGSFRWSMVAATAAVLGLGLWSLGRRGRLGAHRLRPGFFGALAGVGATGALLAIAHPPPFARPSLGPWLALVACAAAAVAAAWWERARRRQDGGV